LKLSDLFALFILVYLLYVGLVEFMNSWLKNELVKKVTSFNPKRYKLINLQVAQDDYTTYVLNCQEDAPLSFYDWLSEVL